MQDKVIKKWYPIIEKLDATSLLTEDQRISFCNFAEDVSRESVKTANYSNGIGDNVYSVLPMMLKILYDVQVQLNKKDISIQFSNVPLPEPIISYVDNVFVTTPDSDFETKRTSVKIENVPHESDIKKFGIDVVQMSNKFLVMQAIVDLLEIALKNGELVVHSSGIFMQTISEPTLSTALVLGYKIKKK